MTVSREPEEVQELLHDIKKDRTNQELVFDPQTGKLVMTSQPDPDQIIATDTAREGYFR